MEQSLPDAANSFIAVLTASQSPWQSISAPSELSPAPSCPHTLVALNMCKFIYLLAHPHAPNEDNEGQSLTQGLSWMISTADLTVIHTLHF